MSEKGKLASQDIRFWKTLKILANLVRSLHTKLLTHLISWQVSCKSFLRTSNERFKTFVIDISMVMSWLDCCARNITVHVESSIQLFLAKESVKSLQAKHETPGGASLSSRPALIALDLGMFSLWYVSRYHVLVLKSLGFASSSQLAIQSKKNHF